MAALNYGVVLRPKQGQTDCGDTWRIIAGDDRTLVVLADGLGSGGLAALASRRAVETVEEHRRETLVQIMQRCDEALRETRGAAVGILAVDHAQRQVSYVGVGNIEVRTCSDSSFKPISTNGIVGANYRAPKLFTHTYSGGEWLVLHSDGLSTRFDLDRELRRPLGSAQEFADRLAEGYARGNDDLAVLVMRLQ